LADVAAAPIQENVSLAPLTTIRVGGPARYFAEAGGVPQLQQLLRWAGEKQLPILVLGGGSNLLISDSGFPGLVIRTQMRGISEEAAEDGTTQLRVAAGENWDAFVAHCVSANLAGVECLSGIPGSVGASPIQNIGAYGQEVKDTIVSVEALDRTTGELRNFTSEELQFSYRMSRFKAEDRDRYIVTSVTFRLRRDGSPSIRYGDLTRYFEEHSITDPTLQQVREAVLSVRRQKAMVWDEAEPNSRSCGSFFMNPIVTLQQHQNVLDVLEREQLLKVDEKMPAFDGGPGKKKLSAAWLMERSGLKKGLRLGGVGLSQKHILAIVNFENGTAAEVLQLVRIVKDAVRERFRVELEPEPIFIGF
jgi:UDP-N-acetylmuramate dehydrogenase